MPNRTVLSMFHLRPRRIGGIETMVRELSAQLGQLGWTSVLCFRDEPPDSVREYLNLPNVRLESADVPSTWGPASNAKIAKLIRKHKPAILHLSFMDFFGPYTWLAKMLGVQKVFYTDQISRPELYSPSRAAAWKRALYRAVVPVSGVFCVSDYVRQCWLDSRRLPASKFTTVYNSVDVERCQASISLAHSFRERHSIPQDKLVIAQVASMIPEKGFADLLQAAQRVVRRVPNAHFLLTGDGPKHDDYADLAKELGIEKQVQLTGLVSDPVGEGLFAAADIVCQASRWNEAFGLVIAEAMACDKPVIGTRVGGIPELVQDGETGFLVERGNVDALANRIINLAGDAKLRMELGEQGRQRCLRLFDHRRNAATIIEHYGLQSISTNGVSRPKGHL